MKLLSTILFALLSILCIGQFENLDNLDAETIKVGKVWECLEYNKDDSVSFFQTHPRGLYTRFDRTGNKIERNFFSMGHLPHEKTVHYMNDANGRNIAWVWIDASYVPSLDRIRIEEYDSLGNNIGYRDFGPGASPDELKRMFYIEHERCTKTERIDTVLIGFNKAIFSISTATITDTLEAKYLYYSNNRLDSSDYYNFRKYDNPRRESNFRVKTIFLYQADQLLEKHVTKSRDGLAIEVKKWRFNSVGLPTEAWYFLFSTNNERIVHTGFDYIYYP